MLKLVAVACLSLAFATQAAAQSVIDRAKSREAEQQKQQQQQQQKAGAPQASAAEAPKNPLKKKKYEDCNRKADAKKLSGEARKRDVSQCMQAKG